MNKEELAVEIMNLTMGNFPISGPKEYMNGVKAIASLLEPHLKTEQDEKKLALLEEMKDMFWRASSYYQRCIDCEAEMEHEIKVNRIIDKTKHTPDCIITRLDAVKEGGMI
jgi:hypothetical protein